VGGLEGEKEGLGGREERDGRTDGCRSLEPRVERREGSESK
jgi:hypothetical protein